MKILAFIANPTAIQKILNYRNRNSAAPRRKLMFKIKLENVIKLTVCLFTAGNPGLGAGGK